MSTQGCDVTLQSSDFHMPPRCASCGGAQETTLYAKKKKGLWGGGSVTRSFQIPYCNACAGRARSVHMKSIAFTVATFGIALVCAAVGLLAPKLHFAILLGAPTLLALAFAIVSITVLGPKAPPAPAMAKGDAVKLVSFSGSRSTLWCANPQWGQAFAQANGVQASPKSRGTGFALGSLWSALIAAPIASVVVWGLAHPQIYVDNAGTEPLQVWIDGKPSMVVPANVNGAPPPYVFTSYGKHTFGWSKVGAPSPEGTVDANATMMDAHLYNPQRTACYWLIAASYGTASTAGIQQGPQPIQEFYTFDKINTWFGDNPQSVEVQEGQTGDTRVAIQRAKACMTLASKGCDLNARIGYVTCQRAAKSDAAFDKCDDDLACAGTPKPATVAAAAPHAPAPTHAAPPPPKPAGGGKGPPPKKK